MTSSRNMDSYLDIVINGSSKKSTGNKIRFDPNYNPNKEHDLMKSSRVIGATPNIPTDIMKSSTVIGATPNVVTDKILTERKISRGDSQKKFMINKQSSLSRKSSKHTIVEDSNNSPKKKRGSNIENKDILSQHNQIGVTKTLNFNSSRNIDQINIENVKEDADDIK